MDFLVKVTVDDVPGASPEELGEALTDAIYGNCDVNFTFSCSCPDCDDQHENEGDLIVRRAEVVWDRQPIPTTIGLPAHPTHP